MWAGLGNCACEHYSAWPVLYHPFTAAVDLDLRAGDLRKKNAARFSGKFRDILAAPIGQILVNPRRDGMGKEETSSIMGTSTTIIAWR